MSACVSVIAHVLLTAVMHTGLQWYASANNVIFFSFSYPQQRNTTSILTIQVYSQGTKYQLWLASASYFLAGSFVCGSFLCSCAEPFPGQKEEKMGASLIKAQGRVSSAVNSQPGATANQWTASTVITINSSRSEQLEGNKKE